MNPAEELRALFLPPPRRTLAVAESLTCGRLQAAIGAVSGASEFFLGGLTAYSAEQKVRHLGVDVAEVERSDAVSPAVAAQMAIGACRMFRSDLAAATTGYAEPNRGRGFRQPAAFWAIARRGNDRVTIVRQGFLEGGRLARVAMQEAVAAEVIAQLVELLRGIRTADTATKLA